MLINRWLLAALLAFLVIEVVGFAYLRRDGYVCPECQGKGEIWVPGAPRFGFFGYWAVCTTCDGTGWYWTYSLTGVAAIFSLIGLLFFFGLFALDYVGCEFYVVMNPYVEQVEKMEWPFNPMYFTWLFVKDRRKWTLYSTIINIPLAISLGTIISGYFIQARVTVGNLVWGFLTAALFVVFVASCLYKGLFKPLTEP